MCVLCVRVWGGRKLTGDLGGITGMPLQTTTTTCGRRQNWNYGNAIVLQLVPKGRGRVAALDEL